MSNLKIVLIGGASYVFAPTVLYDAIVNNGLSECQLVLVDVNQEAVEAMVGLGLRMKQDTGCKIGLSFTTNRLDALSGADYVIVSASIQGARRWMMDYEVLKEYGMPDQARECGGLGGLVHSFRSITLLLDIARDVERLAPNAMILDVTNPMPRVVTAIHRYTTLRVAGFCSIAWRSPSGYGLLAQLVGRLPEEIHAVTAGLNHFAWVVSLKDRKTGEDLLPLLQKRIKLSVNHELNVMNRWYEEYGAVAAGAVAHHAEYMPFQEDVEYAITPPFHGNEADRQIRLTQLKAIARGERDWREVLENPSWEHPVDFAASLSRGEERTFDMLNLPNQGNLPQLPNGHIVEIPATVANGVVRGVTDIYLADGVASLCRAVSRVHELSAEAAVTGDILTAEEAVYVDLAIPDKSKAIRALRKILKQHADLLPQFQS